MAKDTTKTITYTQTGSPIRRDKTQHNSRVK